MPRNKVNVAKKQIFSFENQWLWVGIIVILTLIAYSPVFKAAFVNWDDPRYIDENPLINDFGWKSIQGIFSGFFMGHYHPLTMISIAFDNLIYGNNPAGYHFTNLFLHIINSLLIYLIFSKLIPEKKTVIITSLLFALHPLHVESVAWISERKDVLFAFFFLAAIYTYLQYLDKQQIKWYLYTIGLFILSCLSKSAAITLPFCLIVIEYLKGKDLKSTSLYLNKIPLIFISVVFGILSVYANKPLDAEIESYIYRWSDRILYSFYGFVLYLVKIVLPFRLNAWYPYPVGQYFYFFASVSILFIMGCIYLFFKNFRNNRLVLFCLAFFIFNIILVLQVFPARTTVIAERYTYIPSIGIFLLLAYFYTIYIEKNKKIRLNAQLILIVYLAILSLITFNRSRVWKDSLSLWENVLNKNSTIPVALNNFGLAKSDLGLYSEATIYFDKLIKIKPDFSDGYVNRGYAREQLGDTNGALQDYSRAIELAPQNILAYSNRAMLWSDLNDTLEALRDIFYAIKLQPEQAILYRNLALIHINFKNLDSALLHINHAIKLKRNYSMAYENRGYIYHLKADYNNAVEDYNKAIKLSPKSSGTYFNRAASWFKLGKKNKACMDLKKSYELGNAGAADLYRQYCGAIE